MLNPNGLSCTTAISNMHHSLKYLVKSHKIILKSNMVSPLSETDSISLRHTDKALILTEFSGKNQMILVTIRDNKIKCKSQLRFHITFLI